MVTTKTKPAKDNGLKELRVIKTFKDGAALLSDGSMRTGVVRLSFVNFDTPKTNEDDDGNTSEKYGCAVLLRPGAELAPYKMACERHGKKELGDSYKKLKRKDPLREQDEKVGEYDGFEEGAYFLNVSSKYQPKVTGRAKEEIEPSQFYSGCYARLILKPYDYGMKDRKRTKGNSGIGLGLIAAQFIKDGDPLGGGGIDPNDVFDAEEEDDLIEADDDSFV